MNRMIAAAAAVSILTIPVPQAALASPGPADPPGPAAAPGPDPVRPGPALQSLPLGSMARSAAPAVTPFAMAGVTWDDPAKDLGGTVEVRARSVATGAWSAWKVMASDGRSPAEAGTVDGAGRGRSEPMWFGTSDEVEARTTSGGALPAGVRLDLINPDYPAPAARVAALPPRPVPGVITRRQWGADESIVKLPPEYTLSVKVIFVHHTATANDYNCADSARIVRGIEVYHVRSNGWNDIGYNFLADKCGRLFEGRKGGITHAVLGAHTLGFNSYSSAVAVIGNYDGAGVPSRVRTVISQVAAWKLGTYHLLPTGMSTMLSNGSDRYPEGKRVWLNRISGHRDTGRTDCPGDALYSQLPTLRRVAGAAPAGLRPVSMAGAVAHGPVYYTRGAVRAVWALNTASAMLARFEVYLDGRLYTSALNTGRVASLRMAPGRHRVVIRAVHLNGRAASFTRTFFADTTPPKFVSGPALALRSGPLNGAAPVRLAWGLGDPSGLKSLALTSPRAAGFGIARRSYDTFAAAGRATVWGIRAVDRVGNRAVGTVRRTPVVISDAGGARTGRWVTLRNPAYLSGTAQQSVTAGSGIAWTFVGRGASLVMTRTPASGVVTVYVDGTRVGALNLRSATTANRLAVWARNWGTSGRHTVRIVSTGDRPGVVTDGLIVLR